MHPSDALAWIDTQPTHPSHRPLIPDPYAARLLGGICGWELVAILTGFLPTITALVHPRQRRLAVRAGVVVALSVIAHHLLIESPCFTPTKGQP